MHLISGLGFKESQGLTQVPFPLYFGGVGLPEGRHMGVPSFSV